MKKLLLLFIIFIIFGCINKKTELKEEQPILENITEKYTEEQASKVYKGLKFGMDISELVDSGYISAKDTVKWVPELKYKTIGNLEFEDAVAFFHNNKLYAVYFSSFVDGFKNSSKMLEYVKTLFQAQYGDPIIDTPLIEDSLLVGRKFIPFLWEIRYKQLSGEIEKSNYKNYYHVHISITDTITRHKRDSIALSHQKKDI